MQGQVARILASPHFARSATLNRLLRFVVDLALDGKEQELKEYRLGVDVFDRGADFDPRIDPIVRMQAAKLRARLAEYYAAEGRDDALVIAIPKGGYVPSFSGRQAGAARSRDVSSIAVLPFVSMSGEPDNEYFSDGLTEELINVLTYVPGLRVVARTSVFCFKNSAKDVREIGSMLNVRTVLEGSVRKSGNQLRITAQLIDVSTGYHLLSRTFPREMKDVFALQEELAGAVVTEIMPQMQVESRPLVRTHTGDMEVYNLYLRGMSAATRDFHSPKESVDIFREALNKDPSYAPAWAGMAYAYSLMAWFLLAPASVVMPLAKSAALRAIELDDKLGLGHAVLGMVLCVFDWDWTAGEQAFQKAIEVQPSLAMAHQAYSISCLMPQGRFPEAVLATERALELNPFDAVLAGSAIFTYGSVGDFGAAERQYEIAKHAYSNHATVEAAFGVAHQKQGRMEDALPVFRKACDLAGRPPIGVSSVGQALALLGDTDGANEHLRELTDTPRYYFAAAMLNAGLGNKTEAIRWLEKSRENREIHITMASYDPRFRSLHDEPEFWQLLGQIGLASAVTA